jgi:nucleotide-binding universal stress UspA family protein
MFKRILVPTDGSETALQAARYARALAEKFDGKITLVHVVQNYYSLPAYSVPETVAIPLAVFDSLENNGKLILEKTVEVFAGFAGAVDTVLEYGPPGKQIVEMAAKGNYSVIVMGRRGLSGISGLLLGSVSNHILHYAHCPTLLVKGKDEIE